MTQRDRTRRITYTGMMAAMVILGSMLRGKVDLPLVGESTLHLGNIMCALAGILLGPINGGLAAAIGSFLYDLLFYPAYFSESWITFFTKGALALITGLVAWSVGTHGFNSRRNVVASVAGSLTYLVLYLFKVFTWDGLFQGRLTVQGALNLLAPKLPGSGINAALAIIFAPILAAAIQKALKGQFPRPTNAK